MRRQSITDSAGNAWVGCSGWAYPSWRGEFYPPGTSPKKLLETYAARLNSVEVNYTFRSLPTRSAVEGWLAQTGPEFRFSFKAPQRITHLQRLQDCGAAMDALLEALEPVKTAGRMGAILFQLPPSMKIATERLAQFLEEIRDLNLRTAFEFRHPSWFDPRIYRVLEKFGAALCIAESDDLVTPEIETASFAYYRLRKAEYSASRLGEVASLLREKAARGDVFAYFRHEQAPTGALRAAAVLRDLQGRSA